VVVIVLDTENIALALKSDDVLSRRLGIDKSVKDQRSDDSESHDGVGSDRVDSREKLGHRLDPSAMHQGGCRRSLAAALGVR
jgi:hypothetical protein